MATIKKKVDKKLKQLQKDLKELDNGWVKLLLEQVCNDPLLDADMRSQVNEDKIYNIFSGVIRDMKWKKLMLTQGNKLKLQLEKDLEAVIK